MSVYLLNWLEDLMLLPLAPESEAVVEATATGDDDAFGSDLTSGVFYEMEPRPIDGYGANPAYAEYGSAGQQLIRLGPASFTDRGETLAGADRPNPREISNALMQQHGDIPNSQGASAMFWVWGQFLDHDIDLTQAGDLTAAPIPVPIGDPYFDPFSTGSAMIGFFRVEPMNEPGEGEVREYANQITAFIDASQIYGSSEETLAMLLVEGGKLRINEDGYLEADGAALLTGDVRAAENLALTSMHTLFVREHNRLVDELAELYPELDADQLFQAARVRVEALIQAVTYNEFLPLLLGDAALPDYAGFDSEVDPGISLEFSSAVFRLGHTLLSAEIQRINEDGSEHETGHLALRDAFFVPSEVENSGMDPILRGLADGHSQELDMYLIEDVRSFLFGPPGAGGFDLASLNIQRGRDLGIPTYNGLREAMGLEQAESFSGITSDAAIAAQLEAVYGDVDLVDAWVGGLAEDPVGTGMVGETFAAVLIDQFMRLRAGDPYWSEDRGLPPDEFATLWSTRLSDIIERNTEIGHIQRDVLMAYDRIGGTDGRDRLVGDDDRDLLLGFGGADRLFGGLGDDELVGGPGADFLVGGPGDNLLVGGEGADRFVFDGREKGNSRIADFDLWEDKLVFKKVKMRDVSLEVEDGELTLVLSPLATVTFEGIDFGNLAFDALLI